MADKASWAFAPGSELAPGRKSIRLLGGGQTCEAYLAWDEGLLANVVCKLIRPDQTEKPSARRILGREAGLLARLAHPSLVRRFDAALEGPRPYLVLEYLARPNLRRQLRRQGRLPLERALVLAARVGAALHYMATQGVVHLDVKPSNVMGGAAPRLFDLSTARTHERARDMTRPVGTRIYMSPEQCTPGKRGEIAAPADVWGLGVTLYEAVAGRAAFPQGPDAQDAAPEDRYLQLTGEPAPLPDDVPPEFAHLIRACLEKAPGERPTAARLVADVERMLRALAPGSPQASDARTAAAVSASRN